MKKYVLILATALLCGSASAECFNQIAAKPDYAPLTSKIALTNTENQPFAILSNQTKPTPKEKKLIAQWISEIEKCTAEDPDYRLDEYPPHVKDFFSAHLNGFKIAAAQLHAGKLTYGDYAKDRAEAATAFRANVAKFLADEQAEEERQQEAARQEANERERQDRLIAAQREENARMIAAQQEMQRKQAILDMLARQRNAYQPPAPIQPYQIPIRPTTTTNCNTYGDNTRCTTY